MLVFEREKFKTVHTLLVFNMVFTGIMATEAQVDNKAGAGVSNLITDTIKTDFVIQAESFVNTVTRFNWSDAFAALNVDVKSILSDLVSNIAGGYCIIYDISGYSDKDEVKTMMELIEERNKKLIELLIEQKNQTFINNA